MSAEVKTVSRAKVLHFVSDWIANGLPTPSEIYFQKRIISMKLDSKSDLQAWEGAFRFADNYPPRQLHEQPFPIAAAPERYEEWLVLQTGEWRGWHVHLRSSEPITDEHRRIWAQKQDR